VESLSELQSMVLKGQLAHLCLVYTCVLMPILQKVLAKGVGQAKENWILP